MTAGVRGGAGSRGTRPGGHAGPRGRSGGRPAGTSAWSGIGWALLSSAFFGTSGTFAKALMLSGWSPGATVTVRVAGAALVLAVPALLAVRGRRGVLRRNLGLVIGYGIVAVALTQLFYFLAVQTLSVGVALLLEFLAPVLVVLWLWARHGERPDALTVVGIIASMGGLALVLGIAGGLHVEAGGLAWALGAALCLAVYFMLSAHSTPELPAVTLVGGGMAVGALVLALLGLVGLLPFRASSADVDLAGHLVPPLVPLAGLVLFTAVLAYVTGLLAARSLGARVASFVSLAEVLFAVLVAWIVLGELPTIGQLAGGVLIVLGAAAVKLAEIAAHRDDMPDVAVEPLPPTP